MIKSFGKTDVGKVRIENEDSFAIYDKENIFAIADGVGGQNKGQLASKTAVEIVEEYFTEKGEPHNLEEYFSDLVNYIDKKIVDISHLNIENNGMATTFISCYMKNNSFFITNVGDSRGYLITENNIIKITDDNSYVNELIKAGEITEEEARVHPKKNIITKALGLGEKIVPDFYIGELKENDVILLCSDGLTNEVLDEKIFEIIHKEDDLKNIATLLIDEANNNGGKDNITLILIKEENNGKSISR